MTTALKEQKTMKYKNFTITPSTSGRKTFDYWDGEYDGERVRRADTIQEAKDAISEKIMMEQPAHLVETRGKFQIGGEWQLNITKFWWFEDAVKFAVKFNGRLMKPITDI